MRAAGRDVAVDGFSRPYLTAVASGSAVLGFPAMSPGDRAAGHRTPRGEAAAIAVWIGTPLIYYMYVTPPFAHACSAFAVALFVTIWLRVRDSWSLSGAALLGVSGALDGHGARAGRVFSSPVRPSTLP